LGVGGVSESRTLSVYPNPASSIVHVSRESGGSLQIISETGAVVARPTVAVGSDQIDVSGLTSGVYLLRDPVTNEKQIVVVAH
jgi:hypothetical protein